MKTPEDKYFGKKETTGQPVFIHRLALCEAKRLGMGTKIWAFAHIMEGAKIGKDCNICDHVFIENGAVIGDRVTIKNRVLIWDGVQLQNDVFVGPGVIFTNDRRPRSPRMVGRDTVKRRYQDKNKWLARTVVHEGASIGAGTIVAAGIEIGRYSFVSAGSFVKETVKPHSYVSGHPAVYCGWVCYCGRRLKPDGKNTYMCDECQCRFLLLDGMIVPENS